MPRYPSLCLLLAAFATSAYGRTLLLPSEADTRGVHYSPNSQVVNFQPSIGILSQPGDGDGGETIDGKHFSATNPLNYSYIAASYVKWVEMAGARAVPLIYNEPEEVLRKKFESINGLLFPGGGTHLVDSPYFRTASKLWQWALESNERGDYFPVQGTCLGMELITILVSEDMSFLQEKEFDSQNHATTLTFASPEAKKRSYFSWLPENVRDRLEDRPLTIENHEDGNTMEKFSGNLKLMQFFSVLTTTADRTGKVYVSTIEGRDFPIYATQWHPEKPAYEWGLSEIPHSAEAVMVTQATANFFVNEARKSKHAPTSQRERDAMLIYNFDPIFSGKDGYVMWPYRYTTTMKQMNNVII